MELWTGALSWWKCRWPDLKRAGLFRRILKPQHSIPCGLFSENPVQVDHASAVKKRDHHKFVGGFALSGLLGSGRASMGTLSLGLWIIAVYPAFIAGHQSIKNSGIIIDQFDHLPAVMTTSFFLIFSEPPWTNFAQIFRIFSSSRIIVCTAPTLTSNCALIVSIDTRRSLSMKFFIWPINSGVLSSLRLPHLSSSLTDSLPSLNLLFLLKNWCSIHARWSKSSLTHSIRFSGIFL